VWVQVAALVLALRPVELETLGAAVTADDLLDVGRRRTAGETDELLLGLGGRDAGDGADLAEADLPPGQGLAGVRQLLQRAGDADVLASSDLSQSNTNPPPQVKGVLEPHRR